MHLSQNRESPKTEHMLLPSKLPLGRGDHGGRYASLNRQAFKADS